MQIEKIGGKRVKGGSTQINPEKMLLYPFKENLSLMTQQKQKG